MFDLNILIHNSPLLLKGIIGTVKVFVYSLLLGTICGIPLGVLRNSKVAAIRWAAMAYIEVFRGLPVLITMFFIFFAVPIMFKTDIPNIASAAIGLGLWCMSEIAEVVRGAIRSVPKSQTESAKALALKDWRIQVHIIFPLAFRRMLPPLIGVYTRLAKSTSLAAIIGVGELVMSGQIVVERTMASLEVYTFIMIFFFLLCYPLSLASYYLESKLGR